MAATPAPWMRAAICATPLAGASPPVHVGQVSCEVPAESGPAFDRRAVEVPSVPLQWSELQGFSVSPVRGPRREDPASSIQVSDQLTTSVGGRVHGREAPARSRSAAQTPGGLVLPVSLPTSSLMACFSVFISVSPGAPGPSLCRRARGPRCLSESEPRPLLSHVAEAFAKAP